MWDWLQNMSIASAFLVLSQLTGTLVGSDVLSEIMFVPSVSFGEKFSAIFLTDCQSAIGHHLRDAHGNIDLLNESQFRMLKKCCTKWDCLVYEMLYIRTIRPNLNTQSDYIRAKLFV